MKKNNNHKESRLSQLSPESKLLSAELTVVVGGVRRGEGGGDVAMEELSLSCEELH
ncbi:hypothetical protein [Anabaena sp. CCY 9402-a]|uniref:hypothetical protein n=1 Tax=Anabaena sp. CCY 9402-a TaxID=3103867 RepID=UPI0039C6C8D8